MRQMLCVRVASFPVVSEDAAGTSVDVDGGLRLTTSILARAVAVEMPAEGAGGDFEQYDGDFDDGNDADDEPVLDYDEDGEPWAVDEMSERRRAGLERARAARAAAAARRARTALYHLLRRSFVRWRRQRL